MLTHLVETINGKKEILDNWFIDAKRQTMGEPIYCSVDLRNAGFKIAPVDTNIYPAGFNNLCPSYRREAGRLFKEYFSERFPSAKRIAILAEDHTRNAFYFENLFHLRALLIEAGFEAEITNFSQELTAQATEFQTSENNTITIYRPRIDDGRICIEPFEPDLILVNNDFSSGIPEMIKKIVQPMVPTPLLGWHRRKKSDHFEHYTDIARVFSEKAGIDHWLISAEYTAMSDVNFGDSKKMEELAMKTDEVIEKTKKKYAQYQIKEAPFVFVKNDAGTYGMGIMTVHSGDEFLSLNKKQRSKMKTGKGNRPITDVIIQEGIPTIDRFKGFVAEPVLYLVANSVIGGFFRLNEDKDARSNLNQPGMKFTKLCFHEMLGYSNEYSGKCDLKCLEQMYRTIASLASLAAGCEIHHLTKS